MRISQEENEKLSREYFISLNESRLLDAREALKACLIINGGAATAVLAFSAQLASKGCGDVTWKASVSLALFAFGVVCAALSLGAAYATNSGYANAMLSEIKNDGVNNWIDAQKWHKVALFTALTSVLSFFCGSMFAALAL